MAILKRIKTKEDYNFLKIKSKNFNICLDTFLKKDYLVYELLLNDEIKCICFTEQRNQNLHIIYIYSFEQNNGHAKTLIYNEFINTLSKIIITCHVDETNINSIKLWKSLYFKELDLKLNYKNGNKKLTFIYV